VPFFCSVIVAPSFLCSLSPLQVTLILKEFGLMHYGLNGAEGILCETSGTRVTKIFDHVFPGQLQFLHGPNGKNLLKEYGSDLWVEF